MWKIIVLLVLQGLQSGYAMSRDESIRSYLGHFTSTRNNKAKPEVKKEARDYIVKTFQDHGLDTWTEEFSSNQQGYPGINVVGRVQGKYTGTSSDKILIIGSHYDTVSDTPGVDDNGSGMAVLLQALQEYKNQRKCVQNYTMLFVAFDLEENQPACIVNQSCPCTGKCGSVHFVKNLTRYVDETSGTVQGAFIADTVMNYNTTPNSQPLSEKIKLIFPVQYDKIKKNEFRGDFLAVIERKTNDALLANQFVSHFKTGAYKIVNIALPFDGMPKKLTSGQQNSMAQFLRSDHKSFWNSNDSWPAVFLTDTADLRGFMSDCYHTSCDNIDKVTPDMITFMGKTAEALVGAARVLTEHNDNCPAMKALNCSNVRITSDKATISSPSYPSEYPNDATCSWYKESEYPQSLEFTSFELEDSANCTNDFVEILAGSAADKISRVIGRYCGATKPKGIQVSDKALRVRFVSDASGSKKGFQIVWTTKTPPSEAVKLGGLSLCTAVILPLISSLFFN